MDWDAAAVVGCVTFSMLVVIVSLVTPGIRQRRADRRRLEEACGRRIWTRGR